MKLFALLALTAAAYGASPAAGPAVGAPVPDFAAQDQNGKTHTLRSLLGPKGAILVFYRSADW